MDRCRPFVFGLFFLLPLGCGGTGGDGSHAEAGSEAQATEEAVSEPQAYSLFGEALYEQTDTSGVIRQADSALEAAPDDVELIIAAARVRRDFRQYRQAMELYTRAIELAPTDWRPWRFRGHRQISVRNFQAAVSDLEQARALAPMNWDVAYHLGLAYFLEGRFSEAAAEYLRCLGLADDEGAKEAEFEDFRSCSENSSDPESAVAMTEWGVRAALRAGREEEADALLASVGEDWDVRENVAYYHDLLFYKGLMTEEDLLNPGPDAPYRRETVGFGVANWLLVRGDTARAVALLEELARDPWWPGFGRIAAETDLFRLTR